MTPPIMIALDPGLGSPGWALFEAGVLTAAGRAKAYIKGATQAQKASAIGASLVIAIRLKIGAPQELTLATEWPQIYAGRKGKVDPNDLVGMAAVVGYLLGAFRPTEVLAYKPGEWCKVQKVSADRARLRLGPIDSEAFTSPRGLRIMSRLTPAERAVVPKSHDAVDAIGIGLHALGKLGAVRLYPGATRSPSAPPSPGGFPPAA